MQQGSTRELGAEWQPLIAEARRVRELAYAPYSKFLVGSCLEDEHGQLHAGCNVENASYSGAICAERTAVVKMVSSGSRQVKRIVIVTSSSAPCFPCGFCLQVLREFGREADLVAIDREARTYQRARLGELFPKSFGPEDLQ